MKQTAFNVFLSGGTVAITFPTAFVAKTQSSNGLVTVNAGVAVDVLAANANRKYAQVLNITGVQLNYAYGAAASVATSPLPTNSTLDTVGDTIGKINQQKISIFNPSAAPIQVSVYEEQ